MELKELERERERLRREREKLMMQLKALRMQVSQLEQRVAIPNIYLQPQVAASGDIYTEFLLQLTIPYAEKNPSVGEVERGIKKSLSEKYDVVKVKVERYDLAAYADPTLGAYYSGKITVRIKIKGDLPLKKGDTFLLEGRDTVPIGGAILVEAIVLVLSIIALLVVADRIGGKILEVWKGFLEETEKKLPTFLAIGGITLGGLFLLWKLISS